MKWLILPFLGAGLACAAPVDDFIAKARELHGEAGMKAATFLVEGMPEKDREALTADFLTNNLDLAFKARAEFPWAKDVPEALFFNDVLPYAVFDETRESWRADFLERARPMVKDAKTASEAAHALNREFFKAYEVHYNTGRKRPNQSPSESKELGMATCTGLSIILVDACRAVGIPARAVGTPLWANERGNHTWVEIWDGGWHFTGADEFDEKGLDRGWFVNDAAQAKADVPKHAIYATSWKKDGLSFPMVWAPGSEAVAAVNVTGRYAAGPVAVKPALAIRFLDGDAKDARQVVKGWLTTAAGRRLEAFETKAGTADLNDRAWVPVTPGARYRLQFELPEGAFETDAFAGEAGEGERDLRRSDLRPVPPAILGMSGGQTPAGPLTKDEAARAGALAFEMQVEAQRDARAIELNDKVIAFGDKKLRWMEKTFGDEPAGGHSLWISMHGGGGAPAAVNDQQWQNQIRLYEPKEGIYVAPRAPTDTWNLWHEAHIDPMFQRLIGDYVAVRGVNPDKVYIMGYSAGGDGVWQLAPRMADRFAAAAMMAGHPNDASLLGLRNLPFAIFMGGADAAYDRNKIAAAKTAELDQLEKDDPGGYVHMSRIYEGLPHWMNRKDAEALPWMAGYTRNSWPKKIVWFQDDVTHDRFYWLKIPDKNAAKAGQKIVATVAGQTIRLDGDVPAGMELRLSDDLLDLDQAVTVIVNGKQVASAKVPRTAGAIVDSLKQRLDLPAAASAVMVLP
ncbi:transglutaminase domain-containing protein [Luteolibacter marinus]|uniref:transglutaminase domain-containing protein n=1 Tax=Luteolibacter marinus TaxID=2776705 RepID=UPI0018680121|nr:transglutaminase domain-containing protein [Luteolibacter marinus]